MELPCTQCGKKGLRCRKADKVWGRKRQESTTAKAESAMGQIEYSRVDLVGSIVPPPEDERISSFEEMCISYYLERFPYEGGPSFVIRRFGRNVGSKGVRSALILEYICYLRKSNSVFVDRHQELEYRVQLSPHAGRHRSEQVYRFGIGTHVTIFVTTCGS